MRCVRRGVESCAPYTATELHKSAAVKSPLGAQTVLGDRHDLVCENFVASAVGGPAELARENFPAAGDANRFEPSTRLRKRKSFRSCSSQGAFALDRMWFLFRIVGESKSFSYIINANGVAILKGSAEDSRCNRIFDALLHDALQRSSAKLRVITL